MGKKERDIQVTRDGPHERRIEFSLVRFSAWTDEASGEHLITPESEYAGGHTSGMYGEAGRERALRDLAEGGYVIDLRPLADQPEIVTWVTKAPLPNGRIEGTEVDRLPPEVRESAGGLAPLLDGEFQTLAAMAALR